MYIFLTYYSIMEAIPLDEKYHTYASKTSSDIVSNFGFLFLGLYLLQKQKKLSLLALHFILIFVFSGYYHIKPSDERLMWDMIAIVTTHIIVLSYFMDKRTTLVLYILGVMSVLYWKKYNDLRPYILILIGAPLYLFSKVYSISSVSMYIYAFMIVNIFARFLENNDHYVYELTNERISGHTAKHILGVIGLGLIIKILLTLKKI